MHRINLLRNIVVNWADMESRTRARLKAKDRKALWRFRLLRWRSQYARIAFVLGVWGAMVAGATLALALPGARWFGLTLVGAANCCIWADTTRRLFADHRNGFFEPRQD